MHSGTLQIMLNQKVKNIKQVLDESRKHFITEAHINSYTTKWNNLSFNNLSKKSRKITLRILDMLHYRWEELQSLFDTPYKYWLLLRAFIIKAVTHWPFYAPLTTIPISRDPKELHTRPYQVMKQQETTNSSSGQYPMDDRWDLLRTLPASYYENTLQML